MIAEWAHRRRQIRRRRRHEYAAWVDRFNARAHGAIRDLVSRQAGVTLDPLRRERGSLYLVFRSTALPHPRSAVLRLDDGVGIVLILDEKFRWSEIGPEDSEDRLDYVTSCLFDVVAQYLTGGGVEGAAGIARRHRRHLTFHARDTEFRLWE